LGLATAFTGPADPDRTVLQPGEVVAGEHLAEPITVGDLPEPLAAADRGEQCDRRRVSLCALSLVGEEVEPDVLSVLEEGQLRLDRVGHFSPGSSS
jgi:hypothetical protein